MPCVPCCPTRIAPNPKRSVYANHRNSDGSLAPHQKFCSNTIITSRYTWYSFIPKNLYEQYHNVSNVYYILNALLYLFADGATSPLTTIAPVFVVLFITMLKDGVDDILRHKRDRKLNSLPYTILNLNPEQDLASWESRQASSIRVGDVIKCFKQQAFPSDILILASSNPRGEVGVTTANLDGESNTKKFYAVINTQQAYSSISTTELLNGFDKQISTLTKQLYAHIECQNPVDDLGAFEGRIFTDQSSDADTGIALNINNLVLRGAKLADTDYIVGLVLYTGSDTKLSLNSQQSKRKVSSRQSKASTILVFTFAVMITICIVFSIVGTLWIKQNRSNVWYIAFDSQTSWEFVQTVFRFIFIYNYLIPISNVITIELQQLLLAYFISNDIKMYVPSEDLKSRANNALLADELGQIEYLFSDKTGTLTQNIMILKLFTVLTTNKVYECDTPGEEEDDDDDKDDDLDGEDNEDLSGNDRMKGQQKGNKLGIHELNGRDRLAGLESEQTEEGEEEEVETTANYSSSDSGDEDEGNILHRIQRSKFRYKPFTKIKPDMDKDMRQFLVIAALCHTVQLEHGKSIDTVDGPNGLPGRILNYEASSADEKALVEGASRLGVVFAGQEINTDGSSSKCSYIDLWSYENTSERLQSVTDKPTFLQRQKYIVDAVLEFDSTRKRMTILARHPDGSCHIHSKGAETAMLAAEACPQSAGDRRTLAMKYVTDFAISGLRTLVFSTRQVSENEYNQLLQQLNNAIGLVGEERMEAKRRIYRLIESELQPIGVTGVEDRLQPGVKQCIQDLREAGIQVWVLTGDMAETALTVSQSIGHISADMSLIQIKDCTSQQQATALIFKYLEAIEAINQSQKLQAFAAAANPSRIGLAERSDGFEANSRDSQMISHLGKRLKKFKHAMYKKHRRRTLGLAGESIGLLIDGQSLRHSLHPSIRGAFLDLCLNVSTVLCCRMTPLQKASIVQLIQIGLSKNGTHGMGGVGFPGQGAPITAAIGDGGNDVAMIQQASVGIGIYGKEGREASRAADYAIPQFRHLRRLLFVHGHWSYHRVSFTMLLFYFKCTAFVTTQVLLAFHTGFSQNASFGSVEFILYNLTMTSLGCFLFGMLERHLSDRILYNRPYLYRKISKQSNLHGWYVLLWIFEGIWQGTIIFYVEQYAMAGGPDYSNASFIQTGFAFYGLFDYSLVGCATYAAICISVNLRIVILTRDFTWIIFGGILLSNASFVILLIYQLFAKFNELEYLSFTKLACTPAFWFSLPVAVTTANIPALIWRIMSDTWWTVQISLSRISQGRKRREIRKNWKIWFRALVNGELEYKCAKHEKAARVSLSIPDKTTGQTNDAFN